MMSPSESFSEWTGIPASEMRHGWEFVPLRVGEDLAAVAAVRGSEIHFAIAPNWRGRLITRKRTREFLEPLFKRRGYLTTTAMGAAQADRSRFLERLGFEFSWDEPDRRHFMMTTLPFSRENRPCP